MDCDENVRTCKNRVPEHLRISASDLRAGRLLGTGHFSLVRRATWLGCEVAVKQLPIHDNCRSFESCIKELEILMRLPHPHVVQLLGYFEEQEKRKLSIVMECLGTSLSDIILTRRERHRPFTGCKALDIITKIALGMKFLHARGVTHGGLKTCSILMNVHAQGEFDVKIGGFAFSDCASVTSRSHHRPQAAMAVDVYCFAWICYAILTGRQSRDNYSTNRKMNQALATGVTPKLPADVSHGLEEVICKCWDGEPDNRPDFSNICNRLAELRAARDLQVRKLETTTVTENSSLTWTTYIEDSDQDGTCVKIARVLNTLPNLLMIDPVDVEWRRSIGEGEFSEVYKVNWLGCTFAVKRLKSLSHLQILKEESEFLIKLQHPHIARLIGHSADNSGWIMMERMDMNLRQLIDSRPIKPPFSGNEVWELCYKIALGMNFLHSRKVVHRDIKAANVLVRDYHGRFDVKITDFSESHRIGSPSVANHVAGTRVWRAPEVLKAKRNEPLREEQLKKTDVFSYAMTCYEIITGDNPSAHVNEHDVIAKLRPQLPAGLDPNMVELISKCWDDDPEERPDFSSICHVLASNQVKLHSRVGAFLKFARKFDFIHRCTGGL